MAKLVEDIRNKGVSPVQIVSKILETVTLKKNSKVIVIDANDTTSGVSSSATFVGNCSNNKSGYSTIQYPNGNRVDVPTYCLIPV